VTSVAFSPDGTQLVVGTSPQSAVRVWDAATGGPVRTFNGHTASVNSVAFSPNGKLVVSGSADATLRIWSVETGEEIATLVASSDGEWLAMTPHGFFAASRGNSDLLGVVRGLELTRVAQVHQSLFNPDLVREALAGDPRGEVKQAANIMDLAKVLDSGPAPLVTVLPPSGGPETSIPIIKVQAQIVDRGKGVGRVEWRVNGITVAVGTTLHGDRLNHTVSQELALDPGENIIEVVAYNATNLLASLPAQTTIKFTGRAQEYKPVLHILAIGIDDYIDQGGAGADGETLKFAPLNLAVKDAKSFGADMKRAAEALYQDVRVTYALDRDAAKGKLEAIVEKLSAQINPGDTFIMLAAAHGTSVGGRFYLIPQDYDGGLDPQALARSAIGQEQLQHWLANRIKAKKALLLLDTCESGAAIAGHLRSRIDGPISEAAVGRLHEATGRPVLTAAAVGQFAYEGQINQLVDRHGVFTWSILDALRNGDTNNNGTIELSELVAHVQSLVPKLAAQIGGVGRTASAIAGTTTNELQTARFGSRGEDFVLTRRLQ
jgi:WD domain, G-beta repeat/Caspase domain